MIIKFESGSFAALVRSNKKSLNMLTVLQHICEDNCVKVINRQVKNLSFEEEE